MAESKSAALPLGYAPPAREGRGRRVQVGVGQGQPALQRAGAGGDEVDGERPEAARGQYRRLAAAMFGDLMEQFDAYQKTRNEIGGAASQGQADHGQTDKDR